MNSLKDKIIIVTGGSGLLGKEIIKDLSFKGATAINADINVETNFETKTLNVDITSEESVVNAIKLVSEFYGRIDGLVNNAYPRTKDWGAKFEDIAYEAWQKNVDMQMNTTFLFIQKIMPELLKSKGAIVNMSSIYGVIGPDFTVYDGTEMTMPAAYSAIKGGVVNFTRYLASYFGPNGVRVNAVSPGGIFNNQNPLFVDNYNKKVPLRRMGLPKDISPAVAFLLSNEAAYITGQNLIIDEGWTAI